MKVSVYYAEEEIIRRVPMDEAMEALRRWIEAKAVRTTLLLVDFTIEVRST